MSCRIWPIPSAVAFPSATCNASHSQAFASPFVIQGFQFTTNAALTLPFVSTCAGSPFYAGAPTLFPNGITAVTTLSTTSGAPFSLAGISLAPLYTGFPSGSALFTGMLQGGGVVTQTFTIAGESGATPTLQSFAFSPAFTNLSSVTFAEGGGGGSLYQFTNVAVTTASTVSTTPEPGTLALLSTGLIALLPTARKRRR